MVINLSTTFLVLVRLSARTKLYPGNFKLSSLDEILESKKPLRDI